MWWTNSILKIIIIYGHRVEIIQCSLTANGQLCISVWVCVCACSMTFVCRFIVATAIECPFRKIYDECTVFHFKTKCNWDVSSWSVHSSLCAYNTNKATSESSMQVNCFQMGLFEAGWSIHLRARNLMMLFIFVSVRSCIHFFLHFFIFVRSLCSILCDGLRI